jgi:hypothetical protein
MYRAIRRIATIFFLGFAALAASCGNQSLETPEELLISTYPKDAAFTLTLIMESCRDTCATYQESTCEVEIDGNTIKLSPEVEYERSNDECAEVCNGQVFAHCSIPALGAGTYTIEAGSFKRTITVI